MAPSPSSSATAPRNLWSIHQLKLPRKFAAADKERVVQCLHDRCCGDSPRVGGGGIVGHDHLDLHNVVFFSDKIVAAAQQQQQQQPPPSMHQQYVIDATDLWCNGALFLARRGSRRGPASLADLERIVVWLLEYVDTPKQYEFFYGVILERPAFHCLLMRLVTVGGATAAHWVARTLEAHLGWYQKEDDTAAGGTKRDSGSSTRKCTNATTTTASSSSRGGCCFSCCGCGGRCNNGRNGEDATGRLQKMYHSARFLQTLFMMSQPHCVNDLTSARARELLWRRRAKISSREQLLRTVLTRWTADNATSGIVESALVPMIHLCRRYDLLAHIRGATGSDEPPICGACDDFY